MKAELILLVSLAVSPAWGAADRCAQIAERACSTPTGTELKDSTGMALGFDEKREIQKLVLAHADKIRAGAKRALPSLLQNQEVASKLRAKAGCGAEPCDEKLVDVLNDIYLADFSNGAVENFKKRGFTLGEVRTIGGDAAYDSVKEQLSNEIRDATNPGLDKKYREEMIPEFRKSMKTVLERYVTDERLRAKLIQEVSKVQYGGDVCKAMLFGGTSPAVLAQINAYYDPESRSVLVCRGFSGSVTSDYGLVGTLAHEVGHSLDPCTLKETKVTTVSPWKKIETCLRSKDSVKAKKFSKDCRSDQIVEAIPDFLAAEVLGNMLSRGRLGEKTPDETLNGIANVWRLACAHPETGGNDPHSTPLVRIERILAVQPQVRAALKCAPLPSTVKYCGVKPEAEGVEKVEVVR